MVPWSRGASGAIAAAVCALGLAAGVTAGAQQRGLDESPAPAGTGLILGQVIDGETGKPVGDALVDLLPAIAPTSATSLRGTPRVRVITDGSGRFFVPSLPAGRYNLTTMRPGYLDSRGVLRRLGGSPIPIVLADGQMLTDLKVPIWRPAILTGAVTDDAGEPIVGVEVRAMRRVITGGRARFQSPAAMVTTTDDRGIYRLSSLIPGDYLVVVPSTMTTMPAALMQNGLPEGAAMNEASAAIPEMSTLGRPRNQQIGDLVIMTLNRAPLPPAPAAERIAAYPATFAPSFTPASTTAAAPVTVAIKSGEERRVDVELRSVPAVKVSGTIAGPSGALANVALRLVPAAIGAWMPESGLDAATGLTDAQGRFTLLGVTAGDYVLKVLTPRQSSSAPTPPSTAEKPVLWARQSISVRDADVVDLAIAARPLITVTGRFDFGDKTPPSPLADWTVILDAVSGGHGAGAAITDERGQFVLGVPGGLYTYRPDVDPGWRVKSMTFAGKDVTDAPLDVSADGEFVIHLTDARTQIAGTVRDDRGAPDAHGVVGIFPADRTRWTPQTVTGWRVLSTQTSAAGAYAFSEFPAGEYYVASIPDALADTWQDPRVLEQLARTATRVTIADGDARTIDLRKAAAR